MPSRTQITLEPELDHRAKRKARDLGISFAEYVRRLIKRDLETGPASGGVEALYGIGDSGGSDIARSKDEYLNEAFEGS
jgi:hypothetical protein